MDDTFIDILLQERKYIIIYRKRYTLCFNCKYYFSQIAKITRLSQLNFCVTIVLLHIENSSFTKKKIKKKKDLAHICVPISLDH